MCSRLMEDKKMEIQRLLNAVDDLRKLCAQKDRELERYRKAERENEKSNEVKEVEVNIFLNYEFIHNEIELFFEFVWNFFTGNVEKDFGSIL